MFSFVKRKKSLDIASQLRRLCDLTTPNLCIREKPSRRKDRYNRAIPTLLCPWEGDRPVEDESTIVLTRDISDSGVGLVLSQPFRANRVLVGFFFDAWDPGQPWFFLGDVLRNMAFGGGYWNVGVELDEFANSIYPEKVKPLRALAAKLLPPVSAELTAF